MLDADCVPLGTLGMMSGVGLRPWMVLKVGVAATVALALLRMSWVGDRPRVIMRKKESGVPGK